jgi:ABC-2 type transport system permease protein
MSKRQYFNLIKEFAFAWFKATDQRKILGVLWHFLNPIIIASILYFIFKKSFGSQEHYYFLYILIGTVVWDYFSSTVQSATAVLIWRREMVKNIVFPKEILTLANSGAHFISHMFEIIIILILFAIFKFEINSYLLLLPLIIILETLIVFGLSLIVAFVSIYIEDMEYIWAALVRIGFFLVPIFYQIQNLPKKFQLIVKINPISQLLIFFRDILINHQLPNIINFSIVLIFGLFLFITGLKLFQKYEQSINEKV